jgi:hypothetical protein
MANALQFNKVWKINSWHFFKLVILLYASNTIIKSESDRDLQYTQDNFYIYCTQWKLTVNINKTKIIVFLMDQNPKLHLNTTIM